MYINTFPFCQLPHLAWLSRSDDTFWSELSKEIRADWQVIDAKQLTRLHGNNYDALTVCLCVWELKISTFSFWLVLNCTHLFSLVKLTYANNEQLTNLLVIFLLFIYFLQMGAKCHFDHFFALIVINVVWIYPLFIALNAAGVCVFYSSEPSFSIIKLMWKNKSDWCC